MATKPSPDHVLVSHLGSADQRLVQRDGLPPDQERRPGGPLADAARWILDRHPNDRLLVLLLDDGLAARWDGGLAGYVAALLAIEGESEGRVQVQTTTLPAAARLDMRQLIELQGQFVAQGLGREHQHEVYFNYSSGMPNMQTALVFLRLLRYPRARLLQGEPGGTVEELEFPSTLQEIAVREVTERTREGEALVRKSAYGDFVTEDQAVRRLVERVERYADADLGLLILGETGTGKEHLARIYHARWTLAQSRSHAPFVAVNCGLLDPGLAASALFGHERGAFTGADRQTAGLFRQANGGVLFLDELGDLPVEPTHECGGQGRSSDG